MDLDEGDTLIVVNKRLLQKKLDFPAEFYRKGIPSKLLVKQANIGSSVHLIEQIFDNEDPSVHRYSICTMKSLVESDVVKMQKYESKFSSQKPNNKTRPVGSISLRSSPKEHER